jgi:hypothetical protein
VAGPNNDKAYESYFAVLVGLTVIGRDACADLDGKQQIFRNESRDLILGKAGQDETRFPIREFITD